MVENGSTLLKHNSYKNRQSVSFVDGHASGDAHLQLSQLFEPLWTDPWPKMSRTGVNKQISKQKKSMGR